MSKVNILAETHPHGGGKIHLAEKRGRNSAEGIKKDREKPLYLSSKSSIYVKIGEEESHYI